MSDMFLQRMFNITRRSRAGFQKQNPVHTRNQDHEQYQAQPSSHHTHQHEEYEIASPEFYRAIEAALPPVFTRQTASQVMGGLISAKTFSNLDALGQGPPVKAKIGPKVAYERESFMRWLRQRLR
jgi:hypothetical protein